MIFFSFILLTLTFSQEYAFGSHAEVIETQVICALTTSPPFYDCSESWTIYIYDDTPRDQCNKKGWRVVACVFCNPMRIHISIDYNKEGWHDACDWPILTHFLNLL